MKVLVQLNQGLNQTFLLSFQDEVTSSDVREILDGADKGSAIQKLMIKSDKCVEVFPKDKKKAQNLADFTISQGYTAERLA